MHELYVTKSSDTAVSVCVCVCTVQCVHGMCAVVLLYFCTFLLSY